MKQYLTLENLGWVITSAVVFMMGMSGISKLMGTEEMVNNFRFMHLTDFMGSVGLAEVAGAVCLALPRTSNYGAIIISSVMSAAAALHLSLMGGQGVVTPIVIGLLAWTAHCLRAYTK
jgi:uncharacterized membrane protein YphA (DoxX/SURF4 family)